ncbi:TPA: hypothetical protein L3N15_004132 [Vibrio parahaemolyticus]|nr:hypothetical protein [Vibrio parahaemolyticus]
MPIPKKQLKIIVELMEALPPGKYTSKPAVELIPNGAEPAYLGFFNEDALRSLQRLGVIEVLAQHDDGDHVVKIKERDDFLSAFFAGVSEARNGSDMHYADYSCHPFAFTCGYDHYHARESAKRKPPAYSYSDGYVCHGFEFDDPDGAGVWVQK